MNEYISTTTSVSALIYARPALLDPFGSSEAIAVDEWLTGDVVDADGQPDLRRDCSPILHLALLNAGADHPALGLGQAAQIILGAVPMSSRRPASRKDVDSRSREELLALASTLRLFIVVLEEKGGVGKSVTAIASFETLRLNEGKILLLDADQKNKNMARAGLTKAEDALDARRTEFEGFLFDAAEQLVENIVQGVVIDSAAGGEEHFRRHLGELARYLREHGCRLIVVRPVTTSPLVHDNIASFGKNVMTNDMGVVLVRNMSQGRTDEDFREWHESPDRADMIGRGAVECSIESAGAKFSDLATSCNKSFADIALKPVDELGLSGRTLQIAQRTFTRPVRLFLARWLLRQTNAFRTAFTESIMRTLDKPESQP